MKRVSKSDWLKAALELLVDEGVEALRVERLAKKINISKSGFYWHFKNSDDLRKELIGYWSHEYTDVVINQLKQFPLTPLQQLTYIAKMVIENDLAKYDLGMQTLARSDACLSKLVAKVYRARLGLTRRLFEELGFSGDELEVRAELFVAYHSFGRLLPGRASKKAQLALIETRIELLTKR